MAIDAQERITAFDIDDLTGIGPYSVYPRTSAVEGNQVVNLVGGPYEFANFRAKTTVVLQSKTPTCQYRAVGHPIATAVTEGLVDLAAEALALDPVEFRRRNLMQDGSYPRTSPAGMNFEGLSHEPSLDTLLRMIDYPGLRAEQERLRAQGRSSRHRPGELHRAHQPEPLHVRHRRGAHLRAGRLHRAHRPRRLGRGRHGRHRAGPGHGSHHPPDRRRGRRRADRRRCASSPATRSPRPMAAAPGPAAAPASAARRRCSRASRSRRRP